MSGPSSPEARLSDERATERFGAALGAAVTPGDVVLLEGDLGAGKTTLVRAAARALGVEGEVTSPTFSLVHVLEVTPELDLLHADLYRLTSAVELDELGLAEAIAAGRAIAFVEWGLRFRDALATDGLVVRLDLGEGDERRVTVTSFGARGDSLARRLAAAWCL